MNAFLSLLSRCGAALLLLTGVFVLPGNAAEFLAASWMPQRDRAVLVHVPEGTKTADPQRLQPPHLGTGSGASWLMTATPENLPA